MSKTTKGLISEGVFLQWSAQTLYQVCKPLEHDLPYDYIALDQLKCKWIKIQVKSIFFVKFIKFFSNYKINPKVL